MKVSIVKCKAYGQKQIDEAIKESLKNIDFDSHKYRNKKVLLKPNILGSFEPEQAITTHPSIVYSVAKIFRDAGAEVDVGESYNPFGVKLSESFIRTGIRDAIKKAGARELHFLPNNSIDVGNKKNLVLKQVKLPKELWDYDLIVSLPKMKTHPLVRYTGAVKNIFGFVPGGYKQKYHLHGKNETKFCNMLLDIYQTIPRMNLSIMDAVVGLEGDGPGASGEIKKTGLILCSKNAVALDIVAADVMGYKKDEVLTNKLAKKRGIFSGENDIEVAGNEIKNARVEYKKPAKTALGPISIIAPYFFKIVAKKPCVEHKDCRKCMTCVRICPPKAMRFNRETQQIEIDRKKCILCYCCSEMCPHDAIKLKRSGIARVLVKVREKLPGGKY